MNIANLIEENKESLKIKTSVAYPELRVLSYKRDVFLKGTWNDFLRECRGMVLDSSDNIVSLGFTKIHNFGIEHDAPKIADDEVVRYARKCNGFMIAVTWYNGDLLWSTTGTLDSDYVGYAKEIFDRWSKTEQSEFKKIIENATGETFMFECVHPDDPHIIEEVTGLYFLGSREHSIGSNICILSESTEMWYWENTPVIAMGTNDAKMSEVKKLAKECKHEGFVVYANAPYRATKIKSPHYLIKKLFMRGNIEKLFNRNVKGTIDEEYFPLVSHIKMHQKIFSKMSEQDRKCFIEKFLSDQ